MTDRTATRAIVAIAIAAALAACGSSDPQKFIASAESYMAKAEYRAAIIELKNALDKAPDSARARFLLGKALLAAGDPVSAATELRKAIDLKHSPDEAYPPLARALLQQAAPKKQMMELAGAPVESAPAKAELAAMLAQAHLSYGEPKEARERIDAALALEPGNVSARTAQVQLAAIEGNLTGALEMLGPVLASSPNDGDVLALKGDIETALGRNADAEKSYEQAVAARPALVRARYALVSSLVRNKQLDKAAEQVDQLKKAAPNDPRTWHAIAYVAFARGDDAAAVDAVQKAVQAAPQYLPARYLSGLLDLKRGAYASAEDSLRTVVAKAPNDDGARIALAETLLRRGVPVKAQETLEPTLRRAPDNPVALRLAGEIQLALKKPDASAEFIERANALDKGNLGGRVRLAEVRLAKGETDVGMRDLETLATEDPDRREPDIALINAHLRAREFDKALAAADALIKKQPSSPVGYNAKGTVALAKGDLKGARAAFEKVASLDPKSDSAALNLARVDAIERDYAGVRKRLDEILARNPKYEPALLLMVDLLAATNAPAAEITAAIQRAIAANPASIGPRIALVNYHARQKDWKSALAAAQAAQVAIPDAPQILEALGTVQQAAGEVNQALETWSRLARIQPQNPLPLVRSAGIHASRKDYAAAIAALKGAAALAPDNSAIWVALAGSYMAANQPDAGFAEAKRLQKAQPNRAVGYALEGELYGAQKRLAEASAAYRTAIARQPLAFSVVRQHALLVALGKQDEAAALTQKWVKEHPKDSQVRGYLAQESMKKGDYKAAVPLFRAAVEHDPNNVVLLNNLAWSMSETNDPKALEYAERVYALAPNQPEVVNTYGWILVQKGETARGIELLRKAAELAPNDASKRLRLAQALIKSGDKPAARKELEAAAKAESPAAREQAEKLLKEL